MLKLNNETRVGILFIVALALAIFGYKFLKGRNILTTSQTFYVKYQNVGDLRPSSPVTINGLQIGMVKDMYVDKEDDKTIIVVLNVEGDVDIPKTTIATIVTASVMGGKNVELVINAPCEGGNCAESGTYLTGSMKSFIQSVMGNPQELDAYTEKLRLGLTSVYDSITDPNDPKGVGKTLLAMHQAMENTARLTNKINNLLDASTSGITATANNTAEITKALKANNETITHALNNMERITSQLADGSIQNITAKSGAVLDTVALTMSALKTSLNTMQTSLSRTDSLLRKLNNGEGTTGMLLTDPQLYENLLTTTRQLSLLTQDLRLNPKRYNTVKLKIFGKNKREEYKNPLDDPAYQHLVDSLERAYFQKVKQ